MVKLLNTPFGNYGYVLDRDLQLGNYSVATEHVSRTVYPPIRPSVYDARYLRTTDLSKGSKIMKVSDPHSYVKHGLLHDGQRIRASIEEHLPTIVTKHLPSSGNQSKSNRKSQEGSSRSNTVSNTPSNKNVHWVWKERTKEMERHAGRPTVIKHHRGFAKNYAASRSLTKYLGNPSNNDEEATTDDSDDDDDQDEINTKKKHSSKLIEIDPNEVVLTKLNKLKKKRLKDIYMDMYEKMERERRNLINSRVHTAEKMKNALRLHEQEEQRQLLKSSVDSQRKQLHDVRIKHNHDFSTRLNSLYKKSLSKKPGEPTSDAKADDNIPYPDPKALRISLSRDVYGLPEAENEIRPDTVPAKHIYRFRPGKLLLQSYDQARNNLPTKFNNVWNKVSPTTTPRKSVPQSS